MGCPAFVPVNNPAPHCDLLHGYQWQFHAGVTSEQWHISGNPEGLAVHGYVGFNNKHQCQRRHNRFCPEPFHKATALFYGTVKDASGNPLQEVVAIEATTITIRFLLADGYHRCQRQLYRRRVGRPRAAMIPGRCRWTTQSQFSELRFFRSPRWPKWRHESRGRPGGAGEPHRAPRDQLNHRQCARHNGTNVAVWA